MPMPTTPHSPRRHRDHAALLVLLATAACDVPDFEGAQIQSPPPVFYIQNDAYQQRRMFPDLEVLDHKAWVETSWGFFSGIYINGHPGVLTLEEVERAKAERDESEPRPVTYGDIETLTIDGRTAWGWGEMLSTPEKGIQFVAYRAVIPYDTISYSVEFYGGEPGLKGQPDSLRTIVMSFAVGKTRWNTPLIMIVGGLLLFVVAMLQSRSQARKRRHQSIVLKKIEKKKEEGDADPPGRAPPPHATGE
jgi:hypothetical protein